MIFGLDINFNPGYADSIIKHCHDTGMNEMESWLHLLTAAAALCPKKEMSQTAISMIYDAGEEAQQVEYNEH
tara:strand:- start:514 stop:729 length:216 start_codon:yes stop_codon:yes gene_type:complete